MSYALVPTQGRSKPLLGRFAHPSDFVYWDKISPEHALDTALADPIAENANVEPMHYRRGLDGV
jgi:hypothetical protein